MKTDWRSHVDNNGRTYYFNIKTQISQWKKPPDLVIIAFILKAAVSILKSLQQNQKNI